MNFGQNIALLTLKNVFFIQGTQNTRFLLHFARKSAVWHDDFAPS
jgi:hypothetical protein